MSWDKKLALYLMLIYFIYALSNSFTIGAFVPPIPFFPLIKNLLTKVKELVT